MVGFKEAIAYGKWLFGKEYDHCRETDDGWIGWFVKSEPGVAHESQTWDEFAEVWKQAAGVKELQKIYKTVKD